MSDDDVETATRFVLQILGAEIVDGPPPPGTALHDDPRHPEWRAQWPIVRAP